MNVTAAKYREDGDGYPFLDLTIDGEQAAISRYDLKPAVLDAGYVALDPDWEGRPGILVEVLISVEADRRVPIAGAYTDDPVILKLARRFVKDLNAGKFQPGLALL